MPPRTLELLERLVPVSLPTPLPLRLLTPKVVERALKKLLRLLKVNGLRNGLLKTGLLKLALEPLRNALIARLLKRALGPTRPLARAMDLGVSPNCPTALVLENWPNGAVRLGMKVKAGAEVPRENPAEAGTIRSSRASRDT